MEDKNNEEVKEIEILEYDGEVIEDGFLGIPKLNEEETAVCDTAGAPMDQIIEMITNSITLIKTTYGEDITLEKLKEESLEDYNFYVGMRNDIITNKKNVQEYIKGVKENKDVIFKDRIDALFNIYDYYYKKSPIKEKDDEHCFTSLIFLNSLKRFKDETLGGFYSLNDVCSSVYHIITNYPPRYNENRPSVEHEAIKRIINGIISIVAGYVDEIVEDNYEGFSDSLDVFFNTKDSDKVCRFVSKYVFNNHYLPALYNTDQYTVERKKILGEWESKKKKNPEKKIPVPVNYDILNASMQVRQYVLSVFLNHVFGIKDITSQEDMEKAINDKFLTKEDYIKLIVKVPLVNVFAYIFEEIGDLFTKSVEDGIVEKDKSNITKNFLFTTIVPNTLPLLSYGVRDHEKRFKLLNENHIPEFSYKFDPSVVRPIIKDSISDCINTGLENFIKLSEKVIEEISEGDKE